MPTQPLDEGTVTALVKDATVAPSMHNAQPWRFRYIRGGRTFQVRADPERAVPRTDPRGRAFHIGCGAALLNLRVGAAHVGWDPRTELLPDPADQGLLATVQLSEPAGADEALSRLHPAVHRRHTSRYPFEETEIPAAVQAALCEAAGLEGARLEFPGPVHVEMVLELVEDAESLNFWDPGRDEELARWTRIGAEAAGTSTEGVPEYAFGPRKRGGKAPMRDFAGRRPVAGRGAAEFERSPHLALLNTSDDRPEDWLRAGQALERVLLLATLEGLSSSFATQPVEHADLRWVLRDPSPGSAWCRW